MLDTCRMKNAFGLIHRLDMAEERIIELETPKYVCMCIIRVGGHCRSYWSPSPRSGPLAMFASPSTCSLTVLGRQRALPQVRASIVCSGMSLALALLSSCILASVHRNLF